MATAPLVSISKVKAFQVVNDTTIPLIEGTLLVTEPLRAALAADADVDPDHEPKLYITIKKDETPSSSPTPEDDDEQRDAKPKKEPKQLLIQLFKDTFVGSKGGEGLVWRFSMPEKELGFVEVHMDEDTDDTLAGQFEHVLEYNGFLKTGLVGDADKYGFLLLLFFFLSSL